MTNSTLRINCPTCNGAVLWNNESPYRPFCSKRCQQIDFGDWALENHCIPGEEATVTVDENSEFQH